MLAEQAGCLGEVASRSPRPRCAATSTSRSRCASGSRCWRGSTPRALDEVYDELVLTPGARTLVRTLKRLGYRFAIVSGGFSQVTDRLAARARHRLLRRQRARGRRRPAHRAHRRAGGRPGRQGRRAAALRRRGRGQRGCDGRGRRRRQRPRHARRRRARASRSTPSPWSSRPRTRPSTCRSSTRSSTCSGSPARRSRRPTPRPASSPPPRRSEAGQPRPTWTCVSRRGALIRASAQAHGRPRRPRAPSVGKPSSRATWVACGVALAVVQERRPPARAVGLWPTKHHASWRPSGTLAHSLEDVLGLRRRTGPTSGSTAGRRPTWSCTSAQVSCGARRPRRPARGRARVRRSARNRPAVGRVGGGPRLATSRRARVALGEPLRLAQWPQSTTRRRGCSLRTPRRPPASEAHRVEAAVDVHDLARSSPGRSR